MRKLKKKKQFCIKNINAAVVPDERHIVLADLVTIFTEEAYKICQNRQIAQIIAVKSLQEYIKRNTINMKIVQ